ncbi:MAG TPA: FtsW/RodA/SpoVE family cell cycle protein [Candidatus Binatia bacterium]|nr:FtsW/RodA/SpoVE family cell cycle protein [Candidatus Binatia bacterium]
MGRWRRALAEVTLLAPVAALATLGVLNLGAIGGWPSALRQAPGLLLGLVGYAILRRLRLRSLPWLAVAVYGLAVVLLLAVLLVGVHAHGARRWLALGGFTVQPSELAKLGLLLVLVQVLGAGPTGWRRVGAGLSLAAVPIALTALEPDLSTATLLAGLTLAVLVLARVRLRLLAGIGLGAVLVAPFAERLLRPYQLARLHGFLSASPGNQTELQAHIALAWGGSFGQARGPLHGLLALYLPARETDLAFVSLIEGWGLVAGAAACVAAAALVWRLVVSGRTASDRRAALLAAGLAGLFGLEALVSAGSNLGLLPVAGVPFPFLSYGGTVAATHLAALGLVLGVRRESRRRRWRAPRLEARQHPRLAGLGALGLTGLLAFVAYFAWHVQTTSGASFRQMGLTQMTRCISTPPPRGLVTDRHGVPLAMDAAEDDVQVIPGRLQQDPDATRRLAAALRQPVADLERRLRQNQSQQVVPVARDVPPDVGAQIAAIGAPEIVVSPSPRRVYPYGPLLAPLLGYVGAASPQDLRRWPGLPLSAVVGRDGLERQYDGFLRGVPGSVCFYVDPAGTAVTVASRTPPVPGGTLRLSLDLGLQVAATNALAVALRGAPRQPVGDLGAAVAMDAQSGQVLALASLPSYDDNLFGPPVNVAGLQQLAQLPGSPMLQHATQVAAPPGSTFKLPVGSADAVYGAIPPAQVIPTGKSFDVGGLTLQGWGPLPPQNLIQAVAWSNDVYFYQLALALGPDRIHEVATQLGAGRPTGIDLPDESSGYLGTPQSVSASGGQWYQGTSAILGIGQGPVLATPLQDARWTAAVATGRLVTPHVGLAVGSTPGRFAALPWTAQPLPFGAQLDPVRQGMRMAVTEGTATSLRDLPLAVGAKTGTAQDLSTPGGANDAWLTAAAPMEGPEVVATAFVRGGGDGDVVAAPVVRAILDQYARHRGEIRSTLPMDPA